MEKILQRIDSSIAAFKARREEEKKRKEIFSFLQALLERAGREKVFIFLDPPRHHGFKKPIVVEPDGFVTIGFLSSTSPRISGKEVEEELSSPQKEQQEYINEVLLLILRGEGEIRVGRRE